MHLDIRMVRRTFGEQLYQGLIHRYHYLGYPRPVGEHLEYIAFDEEEVTSFTIVLIPFLSQAMHLHLQDISDGKRYRKAKNRLFHWVTDRCVPADITGQRETCVLPSLPERLASGQVRMLGQRTLTLILHHWYCRLKSQLEEN